MLSGALVLDKPRGWTSHDAVARLRRLLHERSIGHLGTLDPAATGVLPLLIGSATRLARFYASADKVYEARIKFGFATDTYDAEGEAAGERCSVAFERSEIESALAPFRGAIEQVPPPFSAKKIAGVAAYKLARAKKPVELKPVSVEIYDLQVIEMAGDEAVLRVHCSGGTYVRSIAHDLGGALGCGAHLAALRRLRSGEFGIEEAYTVEGLEAMGDTVATALVPASKLLPSIPLVKVNEAVERDIGYGRSFHTSPFHTPANAPTIRVINEEEKLIAIAEAVLPNFYRPVVVLQGR